MHDVLDITSAAHITSAGLLEFRRTGLPAHFHSGMVFNGRRSAATLSNYMGRAKPYDYLYKMLLSNGVNPIEGVSIEDWRSLARHASIGAEFVGVNEDKFPYDFASFLRYNAALQRTIPFRHEMPAPASLDELDMFLKDYGHQYRVQFVEAS